MLEFLVTKVIPIVELTLRRIGLCSSGTINNTVSAANSVGDNVDHDMDTSSG